MGRFVLGAVAAAVTLALAGPAAAAEITRVASRGEPGNPFDLHVSLRWDRALARSQITRERPVLDAAGNPTGVIEDGDELRYTRTVNAVVPRVAIGITEDLELHFEWPYVLGDDRGWRFGIVGGAPAGGLPPAYVSSIESNALDANGAPCGGPCPLFPVAPSTTIYHGGRAGDFEAGFAWGVFNDRKDPTKPYWLVGLDVTFPTAALYDPADRPDATFASPHAAPGNPGPFGEKVWKWDLYTVLSRRLGPIDPYVKAHATIMAKSSSTYSNCDRAEELAARGQMTVAAANCRDGAWSDEASARLPWIAGLTAGTELVPYENELEQQRVSIDVRLFADYTSSQRFYNELTDATGKLHETEDYLTAGGFLGFYLRASRYVSLHATASLATRTSHLLTGESLGRNGSWPRIVADAEGRTVAGELSPDGTTVVPNVSLQNPNFDWRYDVPGRRFRASEIALFELSFGGVLQF